MKVYTASWLALLCLTCALAQADTRPVNKLLYMYRLYYLPFRVDFEPGKEANLILPYFPAQYPEPNRLFTAEELKSLDNDWNELKKGWPGKSLLENTKVGENTSLHISQRLISHKISLNRTPFDGLSLNDRIKVLNALSGKKASIRDAFLQLTFLKSFMTPLEEEKFNFFVVGASWCKSSREYRVILETYLKRFPDPKLNLHSVVVDDPKGKIFDSQLLKTLFPHKTKYTHDSVPRFLAYELVQGEPKVWEEGEALRELYDRFFKKSRGFLNEKAKIFETNRETAADPKISSVGN